MFSILNQCFRISKFFLQPPVIGEVVAGMKAASKDGKITPAEIAVVRAAALARTIGIASSPAWHYHAMVMDAARALEVLLGL